VDVDDLNEIVAKHRLQFLGHKIFLLSEGRQARQKTVEWLGFTTSYDALLMRKKEDFRKDSIVKKKSENELKEIQHTRCGMIVFRSLRCGMKLASSASAQTKD
jgi:hypothetical protein